MAQPRVEARVPGPQAQPNRIGNGGTVPQALSWLAPEATTPCTQSPALTVSSEA